MLSSRIVAAAGMVVVLNGCAGGGHSIASKTPAVAAFDAAQTACANTFREIIQGAEAPANQYASIPAWFNYFSSRSQARGLPVVIGNGAYLMTSGKNTGDACTFTFDIPGTSPPGATLTFGVGDPSFSGPNPPILGPSQGPHLPNAIIGPDGQLSPASK
jgi:hypothetical protein